LRERKTKRSINEFVIYFTLCTFYLVTISVCFFISRFRFKYLPPLEIDGDDLFFVEGFDFTKMTGSGADVVRQLYSIHVVIL
jgi:hypothetical protein